MTSNSPSFANEGQSFSTQEDLAEIAKLQAEAQRLIADDTDPREQHYFMRLDTKTVVRDEAEYMAALSRGVPMKVIPFGHALQLLKEEDARKRKALAKKKARKRAKASRKRNRK